MKFHLRKEREVGKKKEAAKKVVKKVEEEAEKIVQAVTPHDHPAAQNPGGISPIEGAMATDPPAAAPNPGGISPLPPEVDPHG